MNGQKFFLAVLIAPALVLMVGVALAMSATCDDMTRDGTLVCRSAVGVNVPYVEGMHIAWEKIPIYETPDFDATRN